MVSSRRIAREWALRVLYQAEVGRTEMPESQLSSLETLRKQFVALGSRNASGSQLEDLVLNYFTEELKNNLRLLAPPNDRAFGMAAERLCLELPYAYEHRLEKALKTVAPGVLLSPPFLLDPPSDTRFFPSLHLPDELAPLFQKLDPGAKIRYRYFVNEGRVELPKRLAAEIRQDTRNFARSLWSERPPLVFGEELHTYLRERRTEHNAFLTARWKKIGEVCRKQISDWLYTGSFVLRLTDGVAQEIKAIDRAISELSPEYKIERMVAVDRNILRLAGWELMFAPDIPVTATINEAVEIAKKYSTEDSGRFVNGVLGSLAAKYPKPKQKQGEAEEPLTEIEILELPELEEA